MFLTTKPGAWLDPATSAVALTAQLRELAAQAQIGASDVRDALRSVADEWADAAAGARAYDGQPVRDDRIADLLVREAMRLFCLSKVFWNYDTKLFCIGIRSNRDLGLLLDVVCDHLNVPTLVVLGVDRTIGGLVDLLNSAPARVG
ncbi:MAG: hypothetical protein GC191_09005 [Azospirillum sp.]|nr:hypothetical protein [Azospirillum sp.]